LDRFYDQIAKAGGYTVKRVLLVDDNEEILSVVQDALKEPHYRVEYSSDPFAAMTRFATETFDLVICDIKMPGVSGLVMVEELRHSYPHLPVIFITGELSDDSAREALRLRAAGVIEKPFRLRELRDKVAKVI
jgi:DNA-binding response OmpR family regulator